MAYSSILGADMAPVQPSGRDAESLGPSDNSDTGSDAAGTPEAYGDSDAAGTGERASATPGEMREGGDILPDRVVNLSDGEVIAAGDDEFTDLDASDLDAPLDTGDEGSR